VLHLLKVRQACAAGESVVGQCGTDTTLTDQAWGCCHAVHRLGVRLAVLSGFALFGSVLFGLPMTTYHFSQMQALNRELGKLCGDPPQKPLSVCRLHARLLKDL
jgi:hypothetical protein